MTQDIALLFCVVAVATVLLFTQRVRSDLVSMLVLLLLPWLGLIPAGDAFAGFSSGTVVCVLSLMVMGQGLDKSGVTQHLAAPLLRLSGGSPWRLMALCLISVGALSAFMINVGATALFLPIALRLTRHSNLGASTLLMPLGFASMAGGLISTMGASPLILLNDLLAARGIERFGLLSTAPIGLTLLVAAVLMLTLCAPRWLRRVGSAVSGAPAHAGVLESWALQDNLEEVMVPDSSALVGKSRIQAGLNSRFGVQLLAVRQLGRTLMSPSAETIFAAGQRLVVLGTSDAIEQMVEAYGLRQRSQLKRFPEFSGGASAGYAELLVSPRSTFVGKTLRDVGLRRNFAVGPLMLLSGGERFARDFSDRPLRAGDLILVHGAFKEIRKLGLDPNLVLLTPLEADESEDARPLVALAAFLTAIVLSFLGAPLPLAFASGAVAMVFGGVLSAEQAYASVHWRTLFLLAGLIPLGLAMQTTGTSAFIAAGLHDALEGAHPLAILATLAVLSSSMTLVLSNVATTAVLVPTALDLAPLTHIDPHALSLIVALCAQNSFVLPTHQVNALLTVPGGYKNRDYLRLGSAMSLLFLPIAVFGVYWLFGRTG